MSERRLIPVYVLLGVVAVLALAGVPMLTDGGKKGEAVAQTRPQDQPTTRRARSGNPMGNPPGMVDRLVMIDSAEAFQRGKLDGLEIKGNERGVATVVMEQKGEPERYPKRGTWTSDEVVTAFPFTEVIPSWNLVAPPETGVYFEVRVRDAAAGEWSPWLYIGYWGKVRVARKIEEFDGGTSNTDNLTLKKPADAYQIRAIFQSFAAVGDATPALRRVAVVYSGVVKDDAERERLTWKPEVRDDWAVDLKIPFRAQGDSTKALAGQICSPTSVSMVMHHFGVDRPTIENALSIYDEDSGIFGNWGRAVARAGELGLDGWVTRFRNWDQVKATVAQGQPIICSIKAKKGDFQGPYIYESTGGHLIVLRGLTPEGNVIVNDPARRVKGDGFVYNREDVERIWIGHGGVGYVIRKPGT
jgi:hypothetical protein